MPVSELRDKAGVNMAHDIKVGELFSSFDSLKHKVELYERQSNVKFYIRDARTLEAAKGRVTKRKDKFTNADVKYYTIKYCCIHGGMQFKKKKGCIGERVTSTFKQNCKAFISLRVTDDGQNLQVTNMDKKHNHEISRELYKHLRHQRQLSEDAKSKANELLCMKANKKLVQSSVAQETDSLITLKDLSNVGAQDRQPHSNIDLPAVVKTLEEKYRASVRVAADDNMTLRGLFIQDEEMKKCYNAYPELVFAEATYRLADIKVSVYVMTVEDSNGQSEVAAVGLLASEDESTLNWLLETFKEINPAWNKTRVVMTDKDTKARSVFKKNFPSASLLICAYHTLRRFKREVTCNKFGITPCQQNLYREIFQKMAFAKTEEEYDDSYKQLRESSTKPVFDYFNENWHIIKEDWTVGMKFSTGNFLNSTNNRTESFYVKIKSVISAYSTLETFVENLYIVLGSLRSKRDHKAAVMIQKIPTNAYSPGSREAAYFKHLTQYAFKYVAKELEISRNIKEPTKDGNDFVFQTSEGIWRANTTTCQCMFHKSMQLPCRHVLVVRKKMGLNIFDKQLCDQRWSRTYYKQTQRIFQNVTGDNFCNFQDNAATAVSLLKPNQGLSMHEKYRRASTVTNKLASYISEVSDVHFQKRIDFLQSVLQAWEEGQEVALNIIPCDSEEDNNVCDETVLVIDCNPAAYTTY